MLVTLKKEPFLRALAHQGTIVERRNANPILSHILLSTRWKNSDSELALTGTDSDISLFEAVPATITTEGSTTVSVHTLHDIVRKLPGGEPVHLELQGIGTSTPTLHLRCGPSEFSLPTLPSLSFPEIAFKGEGETISIDSAVFRELIRKVRFCMSMEEARHMINGIFLDPVDDTWVAAATDAHRLAVSKIRLPQAILQGLRSVIVGRKAINELFKMLEEIEGEVHLSFSENQLFASLGEIVFSSRLLEGKFPDYKMAVPKDFSFHVDIDLAALGEAVERVAMVSAEKNRFINMKFSQNTLTLSTHSLQYGSGSEQLAVTYDRTETFAVNFNPRYITEICQTTHAKSLTFSFKDPVSSVLVRETGTDETLYVLMPMRI